MRSFEIHNVIASNAPDLASFHNDMEFNITTISTMSCSNLQGLGNIVTGNPGFMDYRSSPPSSFVKFSCENTTKGPTISLKCDDCQLYNDNIYITWQFVDLPNVPATAAGFEFKLTSRDHLRKKHVSFVSGFLRNGSTNSAKFVTYRGKDPNILQFNLFPRIYRNKRNLRLIQPLFHDFLPGSSYNETSQLQASLQGSNDGLVNTTLYLSYLSSYIVEIDNQSTLGPGESIAYIFFFLGGFGYAFWN
jgi:hypothetical protein